MASLPIKPLDGADEYHRWKESVLLRLHSVDVAHVLFDDPPAAAAAPAVVKKWSPDDAVCRGHILAALSDRLFSDYARHTTGRALWQAVARTYDLDSFYVWDLRFREFKFDQRAPLLEQIAHGEALSAATNYKNDESVACMLSQKLLEDLGFTVTFEWNNGGASMERVWHVARAVVLRSMEDDLEAKTAAEQAMADDQEEERVCWSCGMPGHIARNCRA